MDTRLNTPSHEFSKDVRHLLVGQRVIRLHGRMTGRRGRNPLQRVLKRRASIESFEIFRQGPECARAIFGPDQSRHRADFDRRVAERLRAS